MFWLIEKNKNCESGMQCQRKRNGNDTWKHGIAEDERDEVQSGEWMCDTHNNNIYNIGRAEIHIIRCLLRDQKFIDKIVSKEIS